MDNFARWIRKGDVAKRVAAIMVECASHLGYAARGVTSWEQDMLDDWAQRPDKLSIEELARLGDIERQVFGG